MIAQTLRPVHQMHRAIARQRFDLLVAEACFQQDVPRIGAQRRCRAGRIVAEPQHAGPELEKIVAVSSDLLEVEADMLAGARLAQEFTHAPHPGGGHSGFIQLRLEFRSLPAGKGFIEPPRHLEWIDSLVRRRQVETIAERGELAGTVGGDGKPATYYFKVDRVFQGYERVLK